MKNKHRHSQAGVTLVELLISVVAASILFLVIASLMNITHREWGQGTDIQSLSAEMAFTLDVLSQEIRKTNTDSVSISDWGDTLKLGGGIQVFKDGWGSLRLLRNGANLAFLEESVTSFTVESPVITDAGDTLNTIAIKIVAELKYAKDSTVVWMTPRIR